MKVGLVCSGVEMMPLMSVLSTYDYQYHLYMDQAYWPWGDKSQHLLVQRTQIGIDYLTKQGVDAIILSPRAELLFHAGKLTNRNAIQILPLFQTYLYEYALKYSLIGKIGLLCDQCDMTEGTENLFHDVIKGYILSDNQKNTKKFNASFPLRKKNVRMWTYFLTTYGKRDPMVRKTIKYDLRYFSDAGVDTIIPLSWGHIFYEKIIRQRTNWKKTRFHGTDVVKKSFDKISQEKSLQTTSYSVTLHCTDRPTVLLEEKKWMWVLQRGKELLVGIEEIPYGN